MKKLQFQKSNLKDQRALWRLLSVLIVGLSAFFIFRGASAQNETKPQNLPPTSFRIGEKLTYNISFGRFRNVGYAETYVVSRGKLEGRDVIELYSKFKTTELVSAAFYLLDESRTTYASAETNLPLYVRRSSNESGLPLETVSNFLVAPTTNYDLLTLIYQARNVSGNGTFPLQENDKVYTVSMATSGSERIKTDAGEYETTISTVQSEFFTEKGVKDFRINFSTDDQKIPALVRIKTAKGEFRVTLASVQMLEKEPDTSPTPTTVQTPKPVQTPTPIPSPTPYLENHPLSSDLPFVLGETLDYQLSANKQVIGTLRLQAKERKQIAGKDSLLLTATVTQASPGNGIINQNDGIKGYVNPDTLAPHQIEINFSGILKGINQTATFDQQNGLVIFGGANQTAIPVGTHSLLSLIYAVRSFNLKRSKDPKNPINETRVAVFWENKPYVFTLVPSEAEFINLRGEKIAAQLVTIQTGNQTLDALNLRLWLSDDQKRLPLRLAIGNFQADLVSETRIQLSR